MNTNSINQVINVKAFFGSKKYYQTVKKYGQVIAKWHLTNGATI